jgi:hypothetical protein
VSPTATRIVECLSRARLPLEDEKALQAAMLDELQRANINAQSEWGIEGGGAIDFAVTIPQYASDERMPRLPFVGIEVKIAGGKRDIHRQLLKYSGDQRLQELIVATSRPLSLPHLIGGKPAIIVDLGRAWL